MRNCKCSACFLKFSLLISYSLSGNFSILLLLYGYVQCLASLDNPVSDSGIFMEDLCIGIENHKKLTNPFDKNGFFECYKGESLEKVCPGKRTFNPALQRCMPNTKSRTTSKARPRQPSSLASKYRLLPKSLLKVSSTSTTTKKPRRFIRGEII